MKSNERVSETKLFSTQAANGTAWEKALIAGSVSRRDAELRKGIYEKVFSRFEERKEAMKLFSGFTETPLLSNQYFNATMASYVRSFAGFLSIERDMDQPTALLYFMDLLGVTDNRIVLPNLGAENLNGINARFSTAAPLAVGTATYTISTGKKLIPGSVEVKLVHAVDGAVTIVKDDRAGNLLAPAGVLSAGSVNYTSAGTIEFTVGSGWTIASGDSYTISGFEDVAGTPDFNGTTPGNNIMKMDFKNITVTSEPDMLIAQNNLMAIAAMQKAVGVDPQQVAGAKLTELYSKLVNAKLANAVINSHQGNSIDFDSAADITKFLEFRSRLDAFASRLIDVDTALAKKSTKGVQATAYLVGEDMGNSFRKLKAIGAFVDNTESSYINDLLGYYQGIPVLRHTGVDSKTGYAIHKTADGQLAPVIRGIFLPLTNTPGIGNYNNPTQVSQGIYYQEANEAIVPELVQKFTINA